MISLADILVCEGPYDKIRLANLFDCEIVMTDGFQIRKQPEKIAYLKKLAESHHILILTDSDAAGFAIRRFLTDSLPKDAVRQIYIPDRMGKERRKAHPGKEGKLGVEGMDDKSILEAFVKAGILNPDLSPTAKSHAVTSAFVLTPAMLYEDGLLGNEDACERRRKLCALLDLPARLNTRSFCRIISQFTDEEGYRVLLEELDRT